MTTETKNAARISASQARWRCDPAALGFASTSELQSAAQIIGQEDAVDALRFGLENRFRGNNVFVRGLSGFGRLALIHQVIEETSSYSKAVPDRCYIHNFDSPDQPRLLEIPAGRGREFSDLMNAFAEFARKDLPAYLNSDHVKTRQKNLTAQTTARIQTIGKPFDEELRTAGLAMVPMQIGQNTVPVLLPVIDGKPVQGDELQQLRRNGSITDEAFAALTEKISAFEEKFVDLGEAIEQVQIDHQDAMQKLIVDEAEKQVKRQLDKIRKRFALPEIASFLDEVMADLIHHRLMEQEAGIDFTRGYRVNLIRTRAEKTPAPVVSLSNPGVTNLIGSIDREINRNGTVAHTDHLMIKPGALLEADGGFLIIDAQDILMEPGAWPSLLRVLKSGLLEISSSDAMAVFGAPQLRPEPIPVDIKVVLVGDPNIYYLLDVHDARFATLFKVLVDFSDTIDRDESGFAAYANVIANLAERDALLAFSAAAVARLIEHGARICAQKDRLTSRFGRVADIAREASYLAHRERADIVSDEHVKQSVIRSKRRADMPARRFHRNISEGTLLVSVTGKSVGQVNGLAVTSAGPLTYGFPTRITASIGPGGAGAINIERESDLSGAVHTKGFLILSGLLRYLLRLQHPPAFSASIAFEQTYGGIDGDSASGAEFCCLISALTNLPMRQDLAMTGAIDQHGNIMPIGAVSEKVEGFYDACKAVEYTGSQGVIIPRSNVGELMLRDDVVKAIEDNTFSVYAIASITEALALFLEKDAGEINGADYKADTILALAQSRARTYWEIAAKKPD